MRQIQIPFTLQKAANLYEVGGVASAFYRDLDGEAITPDAVRDAIPDFMAQRGGDGIQGGPLRLHHDFWQKFLRQAIDSLRLPTDKQMDLVASIALPLGRVTRMWVDEQGTTHWRGQLSQANPIARIIWQMLQEGLIHLGVSLGGKIFSTQSGGRDRLGRPCTLITQIRLDELSITDNPALRLVEGEDTGAYISALAKSVRTALTAHKESDMDRVERFLAKAIGSVYSASAAMAQGNKVWNSAEGGTTKTGMGRDIGEPKTVSPKGGRSVQMASDSTKTGMGGRSASMIRPKATGNEPKTDVWGMTVAQFTRELGKCCGMKKSEQWSDKELIKMMTDGSYGLTQITDTPPDTLINLVRLLQEISRYSQELPHMSEYQAAGTVDAMGNSLQKALEEFQEKLPDDLMKQTFRPDGATGISSLDIVFPQQYVVYS